MEPSQCGECETKYRSYPAFFERHCWRRQCPKCRAKSREYVETIVDAVRLHEAWKGKIKSDAFTRKRKLRGWFFFGHEWSVHLGKFVRKSVSVDKNTDTYYEQITDIESGQIIHECSESLCDHQGHGSAKFKRSESEPY
jgi:hypothetical protein